MYGKIKEHLEQEIENKKKEGLYKEERIIVTPQDAVIKIDTGQEVINLSLIHISEPTRPN